MRLLAESATHTVCSSRATATPVGLPNRPGPVPLLPKVVWLDQLPPVFVQTEMRLLAASATHTVCPSPATATPVGLPNWPGPVPLLPKVVWLVQVLPDLVQTEMRLLPVSA